MKELASRGNIENSSLIQFVIDGIDDICANKLVLYNAKSLIEFKDKLKCYEVIRGKSKSENKNQVMYSKANHTEAKSDYKKQAVPKRNASRDLKCYNCGSEVEVEATNMCKVSSAHAFMCITVEANNVTFTALIDTGANTIWLPIPRLKI